MVLFQRAKDLKKLELFGKIDDFISLYTSPKLLIYNFCNKI